MKLKTARVMLLAFWMLAFLVYAVLMHATSYKRGVTPKLAFEATWNIAYVFFPILVAFSSFFFAPLARADRKELLRIARMKLDRGSVLAVFGLTGLFHLVVLGYFASAVLVPDWADESHPQTYDDAIANGMKLLVLLSPLAVIPVGWVLNPVSPVQISTASANTASQRPPSSAS